MLLLEEEPVKAQGTSVDVKSGKPEVQVPKASLKSDDFYTFLLL